MSLHFQKIEWILPLGHQHCRRQAYPYVHYSIASIQILSLANILIRAKQLYKFARPNTAPFLYDGRGIGHLRAVQRLIVIDKGCYYRSFFKLSSGKFPL